MSMGGGTTGTTNYGSGSGSSRSIATSSGMSYGTPYLYNWESILPSWVSSSQKKLIPWLESRAQTGLFPQEERQLWGQARGSIEEASQAAGKNLSKSLATSGLSPSSPMVAGSYADLASDKANMTSKAALDFAKMKLAAKDTAIGQLMSSLYASYPAAIGNYLSSTYGSNSDTSSSQYQSSSGNTTSGGGK